MVVVMNDVPNEKLAKDMAGQLNGTQPLLLLVFNDGNEVKSVAGFVSGIEGGNIQFAAVLKQDQAEAITWCYRVPDSQTGPIEEPGEGWESISAAWFLNRVKDHDKVSDQLERENVELPDPGKSPAWPPDFSENERDNAEHNYFVCFKNVRGDTVVATGGKVYVDDVYEVSLADINCCAGGNG